MKLNRKLKEEIKEELRESLKQEKEIDKIIVFGSFLEDSEINDIDVAIFQHSKESYLPLALKYRKLTRSVSKRIPIDIIPVSNNKSDSIFLKEIESGELIYER